MAHTFLQLTCFTVKGLCHEMNFFCVRPLKSNQYFLYEHSAQRDLEFCAWVNT
jgi:hypothetical protein